MANHYYYNYNEPARYEYHHVDPRPRVPATPLPQQVPPQRQSIPIRSIPPVLQRAQRRAMGLTRQESLEKEDHKRFLTKKNLVQTGIMKFSEMWNRQSPQRNEELLRLGDLWGNIAYLAYNVWQNYLIMERNQSIGKEQMADQIKDVLLLQALEERREKAFSEILNAISKREIGSGAYGTVYKCEAFLFGSETLEIVTQLAAIKSVCLTNATSSQKTEALRELQTLKKISDIQDGAGRSGAQYLIRQYYAAHVPAGTSGGESYYLSVQELGSQDMEAYLNEMFWGPVSDISRMDILELLFPALLQGLACLHSHNIIHRDLKPANVMRIIGPDNRVTVKICDFGLSCSPGKRGWAGSTPYMSPDLLEYTKAAPAHDYCSAAVLMASICLRQDFSDEGKREFTKAQRRGPRFVNRYLSRRETCLVEKVDINLCVAIRMKQVIIRALKAQIKVGHPSDYYAAAALDMLNHGSFARMQSFLP